MDWFGIMHVTTILSCDWLLPWPRVVIHDLLSDSKATMEYEPFGAEDDVYIVKE